VQDQPDQPTLSMGDGPDGLIVSQELARELVCPKSLLVVERPRGDRKATRPKSVWLFPFFGTKGKQAWWNKSRVQHGLEEYEGRHTSWD
jgi:hypothetical protein